MDVNLLREDIRNSVYASVLTMENKIDSENKLRSLVKLLSSFNWSINCHIVLVSQYCNSRLSKAQVN